MAQLKSFVLLLAALPAVAQLSEDARQRNIDSFEKVWTTIRDKHWEKNPAGLDWEKVHEEFAPRVQRAQTTQEVRAAIGEMLGRLKQTHFGLVPASVYQSVADDVGGDGYTGIDLRVLDGHAIVVEVDPGSSAEQAGIRPGWKIQGARGRNFDEDINTLKALPELSLTRAVAGRLTGPVGSTVEVSFLNAQDKPEQRTLKLGPPRGDSASFGNLPTSHVWMESKRLANTAYFRFNLFLNLVPVITTFSQIVKDCGACDGMIIDLRGNPGGIGGMAMGLAGFLIDKPNQRLGTMYMRDTKLNFVINPRAERFDGPLAILVDACSASTSEILAGGLKDLGRARIFGTRTAAAALPSLIERLPNGDGFQYAIANYISEGGEPLEARGVKPDVEVVLTREALLTGHDPVIDSALGWIRRQHK